MSLRYKRNSIHIKEGEQRRIQDFRVLIGGCGIGSYIAECLLRMGFENMIIIDGDIVELTNLNRQNYVEADIGVNKAIALKDRLMAIHPDAKIRAYPEFLDPIFKYSGRLRLRPLIRWAARSLRPWRNPRRRGTCPSRPAGICGLRRSSCSDGAR